MATKAICLISDGLDSPVATFLIEQEGVEVIGVHFDNQPFLSREKRGAKRNEREGLGAIEKNEERGKEGKGVIGKIAQTLVNVFKKQEIFQLHVLPHGADLGKIISEAADPKITCILCKRLMLRKAERIAEEVGADILVTGEILGEQASQTIDNLRIIQEALKEKQLVRPNIGLNKEEVIAIARKIGTYTYSEMAAKTYCTAVPPKPSTVVKIPRVKTAEEKLPMEEMIKLSLMKATKRQFYKRK